MDTSEELREALLNLEDARTREARQRQMAEALLEGLRVLVFTEDPHELFLRLFDVMRKPLDFETAFVLTIDDKGSFKPQATSNALFGETVWRPQSMFRRVIEGQPVAAFDTELIDEWRSQPRAVRDSVRSALHFSIHSSERKALFICTHSTRGHFSRDHIALAHRFSILAIQALQKLETENKMINLKKELETKAKLAALNQKLIESEKKLARAKKMEAIGTLAGGVAHDLNNILGGLVSYPELLLLQLPEDSHLRKSILTIQKSGEKAAAVVQDLLTLARRGVIVTEVVNLNAVIAEYLKSPEHEQLQLYHPDVHIETHLEKDALNILGSSTHLSKTVMNLISNAAEAMPEGGKLTVSTENRYIDRPIRGYDDVKEGDYVVLTVSDTGTGIAPDDIEKIFEPFYTKKKMGRSGTGLGMAVVWGTVKDHDGYIDVQSTEGTARPPRLSARDGGQGTTFTLYFPVTRDKLPEDKPSLTIESYGGDGESILIVDDVEEQRQIVSGMLKELGYSVVSVSSGEEAVEYLRTNKVDLLVLDMIMDPGIDGLDTYKTILKLHPGQKAIIASGFSETDRVKELQSLGAGAYIRKPFLLEKIGIAVKEELKR